MMNNYWRALVSLSLACSMHSFARENAADTLKITIPDAETRFLNTNLRLLAAKLNIDAAEAAVLQAELWPNPNFAVEQNVYNKYTGRWFDVTSTGNTDFQIQQLFLLAGKRDKQVSLARINAKIAEHNFADMLRSLKVELRTDLFNVYFLDQSLAFYDESISGLKKTIAAVEAMYEKRSILLSDMLRLKSLLFSLENERLGYWAREAELQGRLHIFLCDSSRSQVIYQVVLDMSKLDDARVDRVKLEDAIEASMLHRPDFKIAQANIEYEKTNLALQKALAIPDLTVGGHYSRQGSYIPDYLALTLSIDLPVFNRNQGNITVSQRTLEVNTLMKNAFAASVEKEVTVAYRNAQACDTLYRNYDKSFTGEYQSLMRGVTMNYRNRNITLLEFTDFYESYRTSMIQWYQLQQQRAEAIEQLNYAVGTTLMELQ